MNIREQSGAHYHWDIKGLQTALTGTAGSEVVVGQKSVQPKKRAWEHSRDQKQGQTPLLQTKISKLRYFISAVNFITDKIKHAKAL